MTLLDRSATFRPVPPEPWGRRLARVRQDVAGLTLSQAADLVGHFLPTTDATISRLESRATPPVGPRQRSRRMLTYVLCMAYGVDPADFGVSDDDMPDEMHIPPRREGMSSTKWQSAPAVVYQLPAHRILTDSGGETLKRDAA